RLGVPRGKQLIEQRSEFVRLDAVVAFLIQQIRAVAERRCQQSMQLGICRATRKQSGELRGAALGVPSSRLFDTKPTKPSRSPRRSSARMPSRSRSNRRTAAFLAFAGQSVP